ncbi:MAG: PorV/PorQ family protein [Flavobacteriales bacterium]|nr:PorV/PorQ family protein [Flavobacteriales bacterium]
MILEPMDMKKTMQRRTLSALVLAAACTSFAWAGNPDRAGSAGATQLLINPFARSGGWAMANSSSLRGVESMFANVAGLARVKKTEVSFTTTNWLQGSDVRINAFGLGQKVGESGVLGLMVTSISYGDIPITIVDQPAGGIGTFRPTSSNLGLAYSKEFSNSIFGGIVVRVATESISNVRASGFCFDAGIHYVTGPTDNMHFGISLKNVGPPMKFNGDGLAVQGLLSSGSDQLTIQQRSERIELPSMMNIGAAYDLNISELHRVTFAGNFTSNSFTKDQFMLGVEYAFKKMIHLRGAYLYEKDITDDKLRETVFTGASGGISVDFPFGPEKGNTLAFDYGYRATNPFSGIHQIGVRLSL